MEKEGEKEEVTENKTKIRNIWEHKRKSKRNAKKSQKKR